MENEHYNLEKNVVSERQMWEEIFMVAPFIVQPMHSIILNIGD